MPIRLNGVELVWVESASETYHARKVTSECTQRGQELENSGLKVAE